MLRTSSQVESIQDIRILFLGMKGVFSYNILNALFDVGANVCSVITPMQKPVTRAIDHDRELPVKQYLPNKLCDLAESHDIPVFKVNSLQDHQLILDINKLAPDLILIACFPFILSDTIRSIARLGCFNLHPSLLPAYRGPMPLFWQFGNGEKNIGVTLHEVTDQLDAGDIILQEPVYLPDGTTGLQANEICSKLGGKLIIKALKLMVSGSLQKTAQNQDNSTYYSHPDNNDFIIPVEWTAQRAFNFIAGTSHWNYPYTIVAGDERFVVKSALSYTNKDSLGKDFEYTGDELCIRFTPGILRVQQ